MKIEIIDDYSVKVTPETNFEQHFWDTLKKEEAQRKATIESLKNNVRELTRELSYLTLLLKRNNIEIEIENENE